MQILVDLEGPEDQKAELRKGGDLLRTLCQEEVDRFDKYLKRYGREYSDGLARFERYVLEGYLYQKIRGHLDETEGQGGPADRRQDGAA